MRPRSLSLSLTLMSITIICGLAIRFLHIGLPIFVMKYGGSVLWSLMIYWIVSTLLRSKQLSLIALTTASITTVVEVFKLYHTPALDAFRLTLPGVLLLGRVFSIWDIFAYWLAIVAGVLLDRYMRATHLR